LFAGDGSRVLQAYCRVHKAGNYSKWDIKIMAARWRKTISGDDQVTKKIRVSKTTNPF